MMTSNSSIGGWGLVAADAYGPGCQLLDTHCGAAGAAADVYIVCNLSCIDLPSLEEYVQQVSGQGGGEPAGTFSSSWGFHGRLADWLAVVTLYDLGARARFTKRLMTCAGGGHCCSGWQQLFAQTVSNAAVSFRGQTMAV
jgi:hypothetical protein